jgi:hypothetical protein
MPVTETSLKYSRDELYTYDEAKEIIGVRWDAITRGVTAQVLTGIRLPHEQNKFLIKYEVEALRGFKQTTSKEARRLVEEARAAHNPNTNSQPELDQLSLTKEMARRESLGENAEQRIERYINSEIRRDPASTALIRAVGKLVGSTEWIIKAGIE